MFIELTGNNGPIMLHFDEFAGIEQKKNKTVVTLKNGKEYTVKEPASEVKLELDKFFDIIMGENT